MIRLEEAHFQHGADAPYNWCETNFFPFCIPEERINGNVYVFTRPVLGVTMADVLVQDRIAPAWEDQLYVDNQQHLPCPASLLDYALPNGLSVKVIEPLRHTRLDYVGFDDTELHLDYRALMVLFDLNDPEMDRWPVRVSAPAGARRFPVITRSPATSPARCGCGAATTRSTASTPAIAVGASARKAARAMPSGCMALSARH